MEARFSVAGARARHETRSKLFTCIFILFYSIKKTLPTEVKRALKRI